MTAPLPVCSAKLSIIRPGQYYGGGPRWNTGCCSFCYLGTQDCTYLSQYELQQDITLDYYVVLRWETILEYWVLFFFLLGTRDHICFQPMGITVGRHTGILGVVLFENVQSVGGICWNTGCCYSLLIISNYLVQGIHHNTGHVRILSFLQPKY